MGVELAQVWRGRERIKEGGSAVEIVQTEILELRIDGTFRHSVAHRFAFAEGGSWVRPTEDFSCAGLWRLFKVHYSGAVPDGLTDRELSFTRAEDSPPLLVERLLVVGGGPGVSEFGGAACRLQPEQEVVMKEGRLAREENAQSRKEGGYTGDKDGSQDDG